MTDQQKKQLATIKTRIADQSKEFDRLCDELAVTETTDERSFWSLLNLITGCLTTIDQALERATK